MFHRQAKASLVQVRVGPQCIPIAGWESCYVLGAVRGHDGSYASVALMSGIVLIDGFATLEEAHAFNRLLLDNPKFFAGTPTVEEMYERSGGETQFFNILRECVRKIQKRKAA